MKKILSIIFLLVFMPMEALSIEVPAEITVTIRPSQEINADNLRVGDTILFQTVENVMNGNDVVFKRGTEVSAIVKRKRNNFIFGAPGEILIGNFQVWADDGSRVALDGSVANMGTARYWIILPGIFVPPLFFVKGNDAKIAPSSTFTLYTKD